ncbi:MAG: TraB/GumN family protein [Bdellovibrionales bacterium]
MKLRLLFLSRICLLTLAFLTYAANGEFNRAWIIEHEGKFSTILGTEHGIHVQPGEFPTPLLESLSKARKIMLEAYPIDLDKHRDDQISKNLSIFSQHEVFLQRGSLRNILSPGALRVLKNILGPERYKNVLSLKPGAAAYLIRPEIRKQMDAHKAEFIRLFVQSKDDPDIARHLERSFMPYEPSPAIAEMITGILGADYGEKIWEYLLTDVQSVETHNADFTGVDRMVAYLATQNHQEIFSLEREEPKRTDLELMMDLVDGKDLNRLLISAGERIHAKLGAIYFTESLISQKMFSIWNKRLYFSDLTAEELVAKMESQYEGLYVDLEIMPGLEKFNEYDQARHKFWVESIAREAREGNLFVAVGIAHLVNHTDNEPTLLDYLRQQGFKVSAWRSNDSCSDLLKK